MIRKDGALVEVGWDEAIAKIVSELKSFKKSEIAGIGSPHASNEDNYVFQKVMKEVIGTKNVDFVQHFNEESEDELLIRADKTPNSLGARQVGVRPAEGGLDIAGITKGIEEGSIKALYALEDDITADPRLAAALPNLQLLVVHAAVHNKTTKVADVVISCSTYAEKNGTMTNFAGRVQRLRPAVATLEHDRAKDGFAMSRWDKFASQNDRWGRSVKKDARPSWRVLTALANALGAKLKYATSEEVFKEITDRLPTFKGMNYVKLDSHGLNINLVESVSKQRVTV
jgi:predicted molibdopterin-dependent oxidoreductase YjgC